MTDFVSLEGPVQLVAGKRVIRIPISAGGDQLAPFAREIGETNGEYLTVVIQPWPAEKLRIEAGRLVVVDNQNCKLRITWLNTSRLSIFFSPLIRMTNTAGIIAITRVINLRIQGLMRR